LAGASVVGGAVVVGGASVVGGAVVVGALLVSLGASLLLTPESAAGADFGAPVAQPDTSNAIDTPTAARVAPDRDRPGVLLIVHSSCVGKSDPSDISRA